MAAPKSFNSTLPYNIKQPLAQQHPAASTPQRHPTPAACTTALFVAPAPLYLKLELLSHIAVSYLGRERPAESIKYASSCLPITVTSSRLTVSSHESAESNYPQQLSTSKATVHPKWRLTQVQKESMPHKATLEMLTDTSSIQQLLRMDNLLHRPKGGLLQHFQLVQDIVHPHFRVFPL